MRRHKKRKITASIIVALLLCLVIFLAWPSQTKAPGLSISKGLDNPPVASPAAPSFNKNQYPLDAASSLWAVVNKGRQLPSDYTPDGLRVPDVPLRLSSSSQEMQVRNDAASAMEQMFGAAKKDGPVLMLGSGYRSYSNQVSTYNGFVQTDGAAKADTYSARPGHSEHQTGLAADIEPADRTCEFEQCFENTPEGKWLSANSYKYGFVIRYPKSAQNVTGYEYEPWHIRYVGRELALQLFQTGQPLEQFFNLQAFPDYPAQSLTLK